MIDQFTKRLDASFEKYLNENKFSGILRVTCKDNILYQRITGLENPYTGVPISEKSRFTWYSLSKPFCAIGLMKLVEQGYISLQDHPSVYLPEAASADKNITIYHLLHHSSGLTDFCQHEDYSMLCLTDMPLNLRELVKSLLDKPLQFVPGTSTQYANINFVLLALIIESASKIPYRVFMKKEVFEPLGMAHAVVDSPGLNIPNRVTGNNLVEDILWPVKNTNMRLMLGAGDINGDIHDVYCLNHAIKKQLLLSAETWNEILTPSPINDFGCGCSITMWHGKKRITHSGGHIGFRNLHIQLPEDDFDIILLSNCGTVDARDPLSEAVYEAYYGTEK